MSLTIVMYHYVRDLQRSRFPGIKGLTVDGFRGQLDYIERHYDVIGGQELLAAIAGTTTLSPRALLLTFDDGFADHFSVVFPMLDERRLTGCFFPTAASIVDDRVLDVHKIHFVLASVPDANQLIGELGTLLAEHGPRFGAATDLNSYRERMSLESRLDSREVVFLKRMLQRDLPMELRSLVVDRLFQKHVSSDEAAFARELYMSVDQVRCLHRHGMTIGSHGYEHVWLDSVDDVTQRRDVMRSLEFLDQVGVDRNEWMMCYPYGAHDQRLLDLLRGLGCRAAFTTRVDIADLAVYDPLRLPRLDTNDLPRAASASVGDWTRRVQPAGAVAP